MSEVAEVFECGTMVEIFALILIFGCVDKLIDGTELDDEFDESKLFERCRAFTGRTPLAAPNKSSVKFH